MDLQKMLLNGQKLILYSYAENAVYIYMYKAQQQGTVNSHTDGYNTRRNTKVCIGLLLVWWRIVILLVSLSQHEHCLFVVVIAFYFTNVMVNLVCTHMYSKAVSTQYWKQKNRSVVLFFQILKGR